MEDIAVGVVGATGMEEVEAEAVEGVKVMEQEVVGEGQGMEVRKVTLSTRLQQYLRFREHWRTALSATSEQ